MRHDRGPGVGFLALGLALTGALGIAACERTSAAARAGSESTLEGKVVLTGSSTVAPLAAEIGRRFEQRHPAVRVDVQTGGSSRGIADARSGAADLGMASRTLAPDEQDLVARPIAVDAVVVIVHATRRGLALTTADLGRIYRGEVRDWAELGGPAGAIVVVDKAAGRATREVFYQHVGLTTGEVRADVVVGDNQQGIKTVAGNPLAIGYVSIGAAIHEAEQGVGLAIATLDGATPTLDALARGALPMTRPLLLLSHGQPEPLAAAFLAFARSVEVHDLVRAQTFVPLGS